VATGSLARRSCRRRLSAYGSLWRFAVTILAASGCAGPPSTAPQTLSGDAKLAAPSTFSIVAFDPDSGDLGVAVQSKFFAVGAVVPWLEAGVGAIATQSYANTTYGPRGLALLRGGKSAAQVVTELTAGDPDRTQRQVGIVDRDGQSAHFTGERCHAWAGARRGKNFTVQGNLLVSSATIDAMANTFKTAKGELAERLITALEAGQGAGGDARGRQSAALVVVRKEGGYAGLNDRYLDLRVDDHPRPIAELRRLLVLARGNDPMSRVRSLFRTGEPTAALRLLRDTLPRTTERPFRQLEGARWLFLVEEPVEAEAIIRRVVANHAHEPDVLFHSAHAYALGRLTKPCLATLKAVLEASPSYRELIERNRHAPPWAPLAKEIGLLLETH
jgi:uncharacterized Ntn-hydrolase superfamily protein